MSEKSQSRTLERFEYTRVCMGVRTHLALFCVEKSSADEAAAAAFERIGQLDSFFSDYREDSELTRLTIRAGSGPVAVSEDLFRVIQTSLEISRASDGAFDITVGPAVSLWRETRISHSLPEVAALERARSLIGWKRIILDETHRTVELRIKGMRLDLGGIGKGYAAQQAVNLLKSRGVSCCLVALAGDIVVGDPPPGQKGWSIAIAQRGEDEPPEGAPRLLLSNAAISTSGDIEQFVDIGGTRYSHLIDPRTGLGMTAQRSATVVSPRGELADAASSALCVLGPQRAERLLRDYPGTGAAFEEVHGERIIWITVDPHHRLHWGPR